MDAREWARLSYEHNAALLKARHALPERAAFHKSLLTADWVREFFAPKERYGRWTVLLNPPKGELLGASVNHALAQGAVERIVLLTAHLANAATEVSRFRSEGYVLRKVLPMELNPASPRFGLALLFVPDRAGLLGRKVQGARKPVKPQEQPVPKKTAQPKKPVRFVQR
jgi:hypothetical protein